MSDDVSYFRALYQVTMETNSLLEPHDVLEAIAHSTAEAMRAKACSVMLLSPDRRHLHHSAAYGLSDRYVRKGPVDVDLSIAHALAGHAVAVRDAGTDPRLQYRAQAVQEGIASILCVPIRLRNEVLGVMRVYTSEPKDFSSDDILFVEAVANLGAIALENARRFAEVKSHYDAARQDLLEWYGCWDVQHGGDSSGGTPS